MAEPKKPQPPARPARTPPEPADPHPADEDPNTHVPDPGRNIVSEQHDSDLEADPENPGSPA
jgi:hypothetical protein